MTNLSTNIDHTNEHKLTAAQVENDCPAKLQDLGKKITAHLTKAASAMTRPNSTAFQPDSC